MKVVRPVQASTSSGQHGHVSPRTVAVIAFPACLPVGFLQIGPVQVVELVALVVAVAVLLERCLTATLVPPPVPALWAVAVVAAAAAATPLSVQEDSTFRADVQLALGVLLGLATFQAVGSWRDVRFLVSSLLATAVLIAVLALPEAAQQQARFGGAVVSGRVTGVFAQPNEFGLFVAMALMIALASVPGRRPTARVFARTSVVVLIAALAVSLSRGAWLGALAGTAGLALLLPTVRRAVLRTVPIAVLLVAVATAVAPDQPQLRILTARVLTITEGAENPYDERPAIYAEALRLTADSPWTGQGPGTFPVASASSIREGESGEAKHAHNALLTVAAETGLLGLVAVLGLTVAVLIAVVRTAQQVRHQALPSAQAVAGAGAALLVVVGHGLIDYPLRNPVIFLLIWLLVGLVFAAERLAGCTSQDRLGGSDGSA